MTFLPHLNGGKSKTDKLFDKIRNAEILNRQKKVAPQGGEELDKRLSVAANTAKMPKYIVISPEVVGGEIMSEIPVCPSVPDQNASAYLISQDNVLNNTTSYANKVREYLEVVQEVENKYVYCKNMIAEADKEIQDFLHELRAPKKSQEDGFKLYELGHYLEVKRQAYKDHAAILKPIAAHAALVKEKIGIPAIEKTMEFVNNMQENQKNRVYMQRSDLLLPVGDKFRALGKDEQEFIRENYEKQKRMA